MSDLATELQSRLQALREAGAGGWDSPALHVVERLLQKAQASDPPLAAYLHARAGTHLQALETAFTTARQKNEQDLAQLTETQPAAQSADLRHALDTGAFADLQRRLRRARRAPAGLPAERHAEQHTRLCRAAEQRGLLAAAGTHSTAALAAALYRDSAAGANTRRTLTRAAATVPVDAGHYNAQRVAVRTLQLLSAYPAYLRAQLARLETIALLPPPPEPKPLPPRNRRKQAGPKRR